MENGVIQIDRGIFSSDINYKPADWFKIWVYLLSNAQRDDYKNLKRGQIYIQYESAARIIKVKRESFIKCVLWCKSEGMLATDRRMRGVVITILNYDQYQYSGNSKAIQKQSKSNLKARLYNKEDKEDNNINIQELEKFIEKWNSIKQIDKQKGLPSTIKINELLIKAWLLKRNEYEVSDIINGVNNYCKDISKRKDDGSGYINHRFTLGEFLIRKGGLDTFINKN